MSCLFFSDLSTLHIISTSRTTRDFVNIKDGYNGWNWRAFVDAERRSFCIVSADGKKRTNLAEAGK
jgi:hypothetical protein